MKNIPALRWELNSGVGITASALSHYGENYHFMNSGYTVVECNHYIQIKIQINFDARKQLLRCFRAS